MDTILINIPVSRMNLWEAELIDGFEWKESEERLKEAGQCKHREKKFREETYCKSHFHYLKEMIERMSDCLLAPIQQKKKRTYCRKAGIESASGRARRSIHWGEKHSVMGVLCQN